MVSTIFLFFLEKNSFFGKNFCRFCVGGCGFNRLCLVVGRVQAWRLGSVKPECIDTYVCMSKNNDQSEAVIGSDTNVSLLEQVGPLALEINCLDIRRIANICVANIPKLVAVKYASLYVLDETNRILHLQAYNHSFLINKIVSLDRKPPSPMVIAVATKQMLFTDDIDSHKTPVITKSQRAFAKNYFTKSCIIAPLVCQNRVIGVLNLADRITKDSFCREDIALVELFRQLVGASIGNIKLFERIQRQAAIDGLTGLINHKTFYECIEKEMWRLRRYGGHIALIMVDIDNLKMINDKFGHRAGDKVIGLVSAKIKDCIRQIDTAARYGGDEFAVILPNTSLADASIVGQRMVSSVANLSITWKKEQIPLSISVGLGEYGSDFSPEDITSCSDQALYMAKHAGKNTVKVFQHALKQ